jgi:hypothetical protein
MVAKINRGLGIEERLGGDRGFVVSDGLRSEQKRAVEAVLDSHDRVVNMWTG